MCSQRTLLVALIVGLIQLAGVSTVDAQLGAQRLNRVGPTDPDNGYPMWYEDENGLKLGLCTHLDMCFFAPPDPALPVTFPDNWPDESFWFASEALMFDADTAVRAMCGVFMEAAFFNDEVIPGDQIAFSRVRIRVDNLQQGGTYTITHPYGVEVFENIGADAGPGVRRGSGVSLTRDIGIDVPGVFTTALFGDIGPFLTWDPAESAPPPGFIGDGITPHSITGSPYGTNFFRVEGPNAGSPSHPNLCADPTLGPDPVAVTDCIETSLWTVMGKLATRFGVEIQRASYTRTSQGTQVSIWARSANNSMLEATLDGVTQIPMMQDGTTGNYFARINLSNALTPPTSVTVTNISDLPPTTVSAPISDEVSVTQAVYDLDSQTLIVRGESSNALESSSLSAGWGFLNSSGGAMDATGTLSLPGVTVPPTSITVISSLGGSAIADVKVIGVMPSILAEAGMNMTVDRGALVLLDGSGSTGATSFLWQQSASLPAGLSPVTLTGAGTTQASFTFPMTDALLTFELTASDGVGGSATDLVTVTNTVIADAGPDQTIGGGGVAQLDGSGSQGYGLEYSWTQVSGPIATLDDPTSSAPSFSFPLEGQTVYYQLTVTGPGGSGSDVVAISAPIAAPVANAGIDRIVFPGERVQLDGGNSLGVIDSYSWTQISGTPVTLGILQPDGSLLPGGGSTPSPTFDFPSFGDLLELQLTVTGPGGSSVDTVIVEASDPSASDILVICPDEAPDAIQCAWYRENKDKWRVEGTSSIPAGQAVTVWHGDPGIGELIGTALVDAAGDWTVQTPNDSGINGAGPLSPGYITAVSELGGIATSAYEIR